MTLLRSCALLLAATAAGRCADPAAQDLFNRVRAKVLDSVKNVPRYTCVENISRTQFAPRLEGSTCKPSTTRGGVMWRDRIRLDVALLEGNEMFAWRGGVFEAREVGALVPNGSSGSGDFISFLASVFGADAETIQFRGVENGLSVFDYTVSLARTHYLYHSRDGQKTAGYHGSFFVEPGTARLTRLTIQTDPFPQEENFCQVDDVLDYRTQEIGGGEFLLPNLAVMNVLFRNGEEAQNETRYSECREYVGEASIRFDDADEQTHEKQRGAPGTPMPPGLRLKIALRAPIQTATAAAGDEIEGLLLKDVKDGKTVIAKTNDRVRGRILRMEQAMYPTPRWVVRVRFYSIDSGGETRMLNMRKLANGPEETFVFPSQGDTVMDRKFQMEWETY